MRILKGKSRRSIIFGAITAATIIILLALNLLLSYFGRHNTMFMDMTPEGLYTLSDRMVEECAFIDELGESDGDKTVKITFCTDPDYLVASDSMRATYFMALSLQNKFDNITVETVNVTLDPTAVSMYKTTSRDSITSADVIFSYGAKYKIVKATSFWTSQNFSYNGEYRVASILASLTAIDKPKAYFLTGHGESYYDPNDPESPMSRDLGVFADLLIERGLEIHTLSVSEVDKIPDDCALLIINNPRVDFTPDESQLDKFGYVSDLEKIDEYLLRESGAVILNKLYDVTLPNLESFCKEWGISFGTSQVYDPDNALFTTIGGESDDSLFAGTYDPDDQNFGYAYYGGYSTLSSAPKMVFSNTGYVYCSLDMGETMIEQGNKFASRNYASFIGTSDNAYTYVGSATDRSERTLIAAGIRKNLDSYTAENSLAYLFCTSSLDVFSNELLGNTSYANYDIWTSIINNISRTDRYATIELGGLSQNSPSFGGKQLVNMQLSTSPSDVYSWDAKYVVKHNRGLSGAATIVYTVIVMTLPVATLALGVVVYIKRKNL